MRTDNFERSQLASEMTIRCQIPLFGLEIKCICKLLNGLKL